MLQVFDNLHEKYTTAAKKADSAGRRCKPAAESVYVQSAV